MTPPVCALIMILWFENHYLQDDKWLKPPLISFVCVSSAGSAANQSDELDAHRRRSCHGAPCDWETRAISHRGFWLTNAQDTWTHAISRKDNLTMDGLGRGWTGVGTILWIKRPFPCRWTCFSPCGNEVDVCVCGPHPRCFVFMSSASWVQLFVRWHRSFSPRLLVLSS